jgi:AraC-like DNA-binding protein
MNLYQKKINQVRKSLYSNEDQLKRVIAARRYIDQHFHEQLDLDLLSSEHMISKYHLLRLFKKYYGQTPRQYLIDKRVKKSKELLKDGKSVTATCFTIGFESLGSFSSLFKLKFGVSPAKFQKEQFSRSIKDSEC